jgi:membrane protease YdiL (CAAX protease family)
LTYGLLSRDPEGVRARREVLLLPPLRLPGQLLWLFASFFVFAAGWMVECAWWRHGDATRASATVRPSSFLALVAVVPLVEEVAFRGWMLRNIRTHVGVRWSVVLTALVFGLIHFDPMALPNHFLFGVATAVAVYSTGSLWPSIAFHALNNVITISSSRLPLEDLVFGPAATSVRLGGWCLTLLGLIGVAISMRWFWRHTDTRAAQTPQPIGPISERPR